MTAYLLHTGRNYPQLAVGKDAQAFLRNFMTSAECSLRPRLNRSQHPLTAGHEWAGFAYAKPPGKINRTQAALEAFALTPLRSATVFSLVFAAFSSLRFVVRKRTMSSWPSSSAHAISVP
jgi:hypothetical protein